MGKISRKGAVTLWLILEGRSRVEALKNDTLSPSNPIFSPNHLTPSSSMDSSKFNLWGHLPRYNWLRLSYFYSPRPWLCDIFAELGLVRWTQSFLGPESIKSSQGAKACAPGLGLLQAGTTSSSFNFVELNSKLILYLPWKCSVGSQKAMGQPDWHPCSWGGRSVGSRAGCRAWQSLSWS